MVTATTLKPMYFSNSFSNCFSWQNFFFSSIINCWRAVRINTPASKKPSNDRSPLPRGAEWRRRSGPGLRQVGRPEKELGWAGCGHAGVERGIYLPHQLRGGVGWVPHTPVTLFFFGWQRWRLLIFNCKYRQLVRLWTVWGWTAKHRQGIKGHTLKAQSLTRESGLSLEAQWQRQNALVREASWEEVEAILPYAPTLEHAL